METQYGWGKKRSVMNYCSDLSPQWLNKWQYVECKMNKSLSGVCFKAYYEKSKKGGIKMPYVTPMYIGHDAIFGYSLFMFPILFLDCMVTERRAGSTFTEMAAESRARIGLANIVCSYCKNLRRAILLYQHPE